MNTRIEVEYWVVDDDGNLAPAGALPDASERAARGDVEPLLEVTTPRCETHAELRRTFVESLEDVLSEAGARDRRLVPLATPINGDRDRSEDGDEVAGAAAATAVDRIHRAISESNACSSVSAGTHVHVDQRRVTEQLNALYALTPALALVNSSPYRRGERVANGARSHCYRRVAANGSRDWRYVNSLEEWTAARRRRFEAIREAALDNGVDPSAFADVSPDDVGWAPVAVHEESATLEWRSPDTALPSQLLQLTADLETVMNRLHRGTVRVGRYDGAARHRGEGGGDDITVGHVTNAEIALPRADIVADLTETAIDIGLDATAVTAYLERMGFDVADYHPIATRIDGRQYVTRADARELRLEYAGRLEDDVRALVRDLE